MGVWVYIDESLMYLWLCCDMVSSGCQRRSWKNSTHLQRAAPAACTWSLGYFSELVSGRHLARCYRASLRLLLEEFQSLGVYARAVRTWKSGHFFYVPSLARPCFAQCLARQWIHVPRQLLEASERISIFFYVLGWTWILWSIHGLLSGIAARRSVRGRCFDFMDCSCSWHLESGHYFIAPSIRQARRRCLKIV